MDKNNVKQNARKHTHTRIYIYIYIMKQGDGCVDIIKTMHIDTSIVVAIFFDRDDCRSDIW